VVTPLDVHRKEFRRVLRGYDEQEVDEFLGTVAEELERLRRENAALRTAPPETTARAPVMPSSNLKDIAVSQARAGITPQEVEARLEGWRQEVEQILDSSTVEIAQRAEEVLVLAEKRLGELAAQVEDRTERVLTEAQRRLDKILHDTAEKFKGLLGAASERKKDRPAAGETGAEPEGRVRKERSNSLGRGSRRSVSRG